MNEDNFTCTWCLFTSPAMKPARFSKRSGYEEIIDAGHPPRIYPGIFRVLLTYTHVSTWPPNMQIYWNKRKYSHKKKAQLQQPLVWYVQVEVFCQFPSSSPDDLHPSPTRWTILQIRLPLFDFQKTVAITSLLACERRRISGDKQQPEIRLHLFRLLLSLHETGN